METLPEAQKQATGRDLRSEGRAVRVAMAERDIRPSMVASALGVSIQSVSNALAGRKARMLDRVRDYVSAQPLPD